MVYSMLGPSSGDQKRLQLMDYNPPRRAVTCRALGRRGPIRNLLFIYLFIYRITPYVEKACNML